MDKSEAGGGFVSFLDKMKTLFEELLQKLKNVKNGNPEEGDTITLILKWIYKLRAVFLAIPVAIAAIFLAIFNMIKLPEQMAVYFPAVAGEEVVVKLLEVDKGTAIIVPVLVTAVCLLMMFCSRRQVYPWLISVFSLVLPVFFLFISIFPG